MESKTNQKTKTFDAVILAGGMGSRLAPITDDLPKPLVPVGGVPVLERLTDVLKQNGFGEALMTVCALPEAFDQYRDPNLFLEVVKGSVPLGSAGCVRAVKDRLSETFLVISGDTVTDFDLRHAIDTHKKERRLATILLTHADEPGEFGIVSIDGNRIVGFSEKPSWRDTFSDRISTGIYILERSLLDEIPEGVCYDFGRDFFPKLLKRGVELHGEVLPGHWWDIGSPESYYRCNMHITNGENAVGQECVIHPEAVVTRSVLHSGVTVEKGARVEGCILCSGVHVGEGCILPSGCVIGSDTVLENGVVLRSGARVKGGLRIGMGSTGSRFAFGNVTKRYFGDEGITGDRAELDSSFCLRLGRALKTPGRSLKVGILHNSSAGGKLYAELISRGAQDAGAQVIELCEAFPAVVAFAAASYGLDIALYLELQESVGRVRIRFCDGEGLPLSREQQRGIEQRLASGNFDTCITPFPREVPEKEERVLWRYCNWLQDRVGSLSGVKFTVSRRDDAGEFLYSNAKELGAEVSYGEGESDSFTVSPDGYRACAYTKSGKPLSYWHLVAIAAAESDERVIRLPARVPKTVEDYLRNMGKELSLYTDSRTLADRFTELKSPYVNDGVLLCLLVAKQLCLRGITLDEALSALPSFYVVKKELPVVPAGEAADRRAARISAISEKGSFPARIFWQNGCVTFFPNAAGGYTLLAEATGWEAAEEICAEAEKLL